MIQPKTLRIGLWFFSLLGAFAFGHFTGNRLGESDSALNTSSPSSDTLEMHSKNTQRGSLARTESLEGVVLPLQSDPLEQFTFLSSNDSKSEMVEDIARHDIPVARMQALLAVLDVLNPEEFQDAIKGLERSGLVDLRTMEFETLYSAWAQVAPEDAMAYASKQFENTAAQKTVLQSWSTQDPDAALAWARNHYASPNGNVANPWELSVIQGAVAANLELVTDIALSMPFGSKGREAAASTILGYLNSVNPDQAYEWTQAIEDEEFQSITMDILAQKIAQTDPLNAFARVSAMNDGSGLEHVAEEIAHRRYLENPDETKSWVKQLPASAVGNAANAVVVQNSNTDLLGTSQWLDEVIANNPAGYYQDAIETMVKQSTLKDPQLAVEWVSDLHSEQTKNRYYQEVLSEWVDTDSVSANDWVQYNYKSLPESVLTRFFPGFVPELFSHNQDESALVSETP